MGNYRKARDVFDVCQRTFWRLRDTHTHTRSLSLARSSTALCLSLFAALCVSSTCACADVVWDARGVPDLGLDREDDGERQENARAQFELAARCLHLQQRVARLSPRLARLLRAKGRLSERAARQLLVLRRRLALAYQCATSVSPCDRLPSLTQMRPPPL
jgi:hypothetical protein